MNTIYGIFREQVAAQPDGTAVFDGRRSVTFSELDALAGTIAAGFPLSRPKFVGVVMDHSVEMIASILSDLKIVAAYVPVEPTFPIERIRFIMKECKADFVITQKKYAAMLEGLTLHFVEQGTAVDSNVLPLPEPASPEDIAYMLYTSGTTELLRAWSWRTGMSATMPGHSKMNSIPDPAM